MQSPDYKKDESWWLACPALGKECPLKVPDRVKDVNTSVVQEINDRICLPVNEDSGAAVFFVHGTMVGSTEGNADYREAFKTKEQLRNYVLWQSTAFNVKCKLYVPTYRFSTFANVGNVQKRFAFAYQDVRSAFLAFRDFIGEDTPFFVAGHSQGAIHILRLLREEELGPTFLGAICPGAPCTEGVDSKTLLWNCALPNCKPEETMIGRFALSRPNTVLTHTLDLPTDNNTPVFGFDASDKGKPTLFLDAYASRSVQNGLLTFVADTPAQTTFLAFFASPNLDCHTFDFYLCWTDVRRYVARAVDAYFASSLRGPTSVIPQEKEGVVVVDGEAHRKKEVRQV